MFGFLRRKEKPENLEKNPCGTGENNTSNKLNSHMILHKLGLEPGTIEVRGQWTNHYTTHNTKPHPFSLSNHKTQKHLSATIPRHTHAHFVHATTTVIVFKSIFYIFFSRSNLCLTGRVLPLVNSFWSPVDSLSIL